jgi:hypothetical protein
MHLGDHVLGAGAQDGVVIASVREAYPKGVTVYNFEVEGDHTYFVEDGQGEKTPVWVHNACSPTSGNNIFSARGRLRHLAHAELWQAFGYTVKKALANGKIPDAFKIVFNKAGKPIAAIIRELKPDKLNSVGRGLKQLNGYAKQLLKELKKANPDLKLDDIMLIIDTYR